MKTFTISNLKDAKITGWDFDKWPSIITVTGPDVEVRDEYHSMHELYQHRMALNIALFNMVHIYRKHPYGPEVMKSKLHNDGTMFDGYFIVMMTTKEGQISYHYDLKHWDKFNIPEVERTPPYDGHGSLQVMERLMKL